MTTVAFIFARGGSRGIPRKNLRLLADKPLLVHAIEAAKAATLVDEVVVSTEDSGILTVAGKAGVSLIERPVTLAADDSPEWLSWQHAIGVTAWVDIFVSVPCTAPLRIPDDIDNCIRALDEGTDAVITVTEAHRNPFYNQVVLDGRGCARTVIGYGEVVNRQAAPVLYDATTVAYAARPEFILRASSIWEGRVRAVVVPAERAIDIDTEMDLRIAEALMDERLKREVAW